MNYKKVFIVVLIVILSIQNLSFAENIVESNNISTPYNIKASSNKVSSNSPQNPNINARYGIIFDRNHKRIIYGKNENTKCKMASTTKIMTAIVVLENCQDINSIVTVSKKAARNWWVEAWFIRK